MTIENQMISTFIDLEPNWAKDERLRPQLEKELTERLIQNVPAMVTRLSKLEPILTTEVKGYIDFMREATEAFMCGHWRAVVALVGTAAESFTDDLYDKVKWLGSVDRKQMSKAELFGPDEYLPEKRKLSILRLFGLIDLSSYDKLIKIKELRDQYVHPTKESRDIGQDAREAISKFRAVLKERFDQAYTIEKGKIVPRQRPKQAFELKIVTLRVPSLPGGVS